MPKQTQYEFKGLADWVEIFKAGKQTDSRGRTQEFTTEHLDQVVANHDPAHPAPHIITHGKFSPFAYGQSAELKRDGNSLLLKSKNIEPQFEKLVKDGRLYERSVQLKTTDNGWKLGHIAWLGAEAPAIELTPVEFKLSQDENDFEFKADSYTPNVISNLMRGIRDLFIEKFGTDTANKAIPDYEIQSLSQHANDLSQQNNPSPTLFNQHEPNTGEPTMPDFTQEQHDAAVASAVEQAKKEAQTEFAASQTETQKQLDAERTKRLTAEYQASITTLIDAGKVTPAQATGMSEFMLAISNNNADATFEFSQGEGDKATPKKQSAVEWFREFTQSIGKQVDLGKSKDDGVTDFGDDSMAIANAAVEFQTSQADKGLTVSVSDAVAHVTKGAK